MVWQTPKLKALAKTMLSFPDAGSLCKFLRDLCTLEELAELSRRWQAVQLLHDGLPYRAVAKRTGLSTTTVTRIAHWLHHGEGGYRAALRQQKRR
ncbi:MAG: helix-turn-helix domain-containing protein [Candidatus Magasanikbacteria bacterium]|nr:helix-turn-helix domain-containing protein [Candidatus Magasanikbacteria bacterium]